MCDFIFDDGLTIKINVNDMLNHLWKNSPGLFIDWIRNNLPSVTGYVENLNKVIDDFTLLENALSNKE